MTVALSGIAQRGFDTAEFARRCASAQAVMATLNLGAVLLASDCLLYTSPSPRDKRQSRMPGCA